MAAAVFQEKSESKAKEIVEEFRSQIGRSSWKHATDLTHPEKVLFARKLSQSGGRYFAVISNKSTLREYKSKIKNDPQSFYNKCACYLLELVCSYLARFEVQEQQLSAYFEKRNNHDYSRLINYIHKVRENPQYPQSKSLKLLNPMSIGTLKKGENDAMEAADMVSHAVYQCANKTPKNFFIPEPRYFHELAPRFAGDTNGKILGTGIKCIHSLPDLNLDKDISLALRNAKAKKPIS